MRVERTDDQVRATLGHLRTIVGHRFCALHLERGVIGQRSEELAPLAPEIEVTTSAVRDLGEGELVPPGRVLDERVGSAGNRAPQPVVDRHRGGRGGDRSRVQERSLHVGVLVDLVGQAGQVAHHHRAPLVLRYQ